MRQRKLRAMPVTDKARHVVGLVSDADFLDDIGLHPYETIASRFRRLIRPLESDFPGVPEVVGQIMRKGVASASTASNIVDLVPLLADSRLRHVPIVDDQRHLVGIVAQSDLIGALYQTVSPSEASDRNADSNRAVPRPHARQRLASSTR